jgi:D-sedoheptulose 7-phosphate isomerase
MKKAIKNYFKEMTGLMNSIVVTANGKTLDLYQGIEAACRSVREIANRGKKVMFIGNGGSAAIAGHMAVDFWKNGGIRATAFNDSSLLTCLSNDCGYEHVFEKPVEMFADRDDLLIAISSSGNSPNILNGVKAAREKGLKVITLSGFNPNNKLASLGDINFFVFSSEYGPVEVLHQFICHYILDIYTKERQVANAKD